MMLCISWMLTGLEFFQADFIIRKQTARYHDQQNSTIKQIFRVSEFSTLEKSYTTNGPKSSSVWSEYFWNFPRAAAKYCNVLLSSNLFSNVSIHLFCTCEFWKQVKNLTGDPAIHLEYDLTDFLNSGNSVWHRFSPQGNKTNRISYYFTPTNTSFLTSPLINFDHILSTQTFMNNTHTFIAGIFLFSFVSLFPFWCPKNKQLPRLHLYYHNPVIY